MSGSKRIALYGGTFDPVHKGHITVANALSKMFWLEEVVFIPASVAPHKRVTDVTPGLHRYAMLALATQDEPRWRVSTLELDAPEKPYTFETLARMRENLGGESELFFIMGADSWMEITTWREWEKVLTATNHIVVARPGYELNAEHVTPEVRGRLVDLRRHDHEPAPIEIANGEVRKIYVTDVVKMDISARSIRQAVREGRGADWLPWVPPPVANYIAKYELYGAK